MKLKLYNTETREKEVLEPAHGNTVKMYTCGPTIYDFAHIGNFRTYVFEDLLRRSIKFFGYGVEQVMNITDLDDKTIGGAIKKNIPLKKFTEPFRIAFFEDLAKLNIERVEHYPNATDYIPEMIEMVEKLMEKGIAYRSKNESIYFSIGHFPSYGRLSHLNLQDLKVNASGDNVADEYEKDNLADFVLWKAHDQCRDGKIFWESPFGPGRPGWHIECSAMAMKLLGHSIDIHCGGVDNMFPHHENEIAQSECYSGCKFVRHWLHAEHLLVDHKKMSKSLGNFYTLRALLKKGYTGPEVRYLLLSNHYRTQLNFTFEGLDGARVSLNRIGDLIDRLKNITKQGPVSVSTSIVDAADPKFKAALADDLNISAALAVLFDLIREVNSRADEDMVSTADALTLLEMLNRWDRVLGVLPLKRSEEAPEHLQVKLQERNKARVEKNWALSDQLRQEIADAGYIIEDTPNGGRLKRK
jgi:cysteinyl-tRNA synthetase